MLRLLTGGAALLAIWPSHSLPAEKELQSLVSSRNDSVDSVLRRLQVVEQKLPFSPTPCRIRGEFALQNHDLKQALAANLELVRRTPHRSSSWCRLAKVELLNGRWQDAEDSLRQAELWYPYNPRLFPLLGVAYLQQMPSFLSLPLPMRLNSMNRLLNLPSRLEKDAHGFVVRLNPETEGETTLPREIVTLLNQTGIKTSNGEQISFASDDLRVESAHNPYHKTH